MQDERSLTKQPLIESEAVSWWSWRPGTRPLRTFLFSGLLGLLALFLLLSGSVELLAGVLDSSSPPLQVPGIVTAHGRDTLGSPQLTLHLKRAGFPSTISLVVSAAAARELVNGSAVNVDYAPHQRIPYALEAGGRSYPLPDTSISGNLWQTLVLMLFGLLLLPYPALLFYWSWRDLRGGQRCRRVATVVALRTSRQTTTRTPGLVPRTVRTWYGVALQIEHPSATEPEILALGIHQEQHAQLRRGDQVEITYSSYLHYLYDLKRL